MSNFPSVHQFPNLVSAPALPLLHAPIHVYADIDELLNSNFFPSPDAGSHDVTFDFGTLALDSALSNKLWSAEPSAVATQAALTLGAMQGVWF